MQNDLPWRCNRHHALAEPRLLLSAAAIGHDSMQFVSSLSIPQLSFLADYTVHGRSLLPFSVLLELSFSAVASATAAAGVGTSKTLMLASAVNHYSGHVRLEDSYYMLCNLAPHTGQLTVAYRRGSPSSLRNCLNASALSMYGKDANLTKPERLSTCLVSTWTEFH